MIRNLISFCLTIGILFIIYSFVYSQFPEARQVLDSMKTAVLSAYQWSVARWGATAVGGVLILLVLTQVVRSR